MRLIALKTLPGHHAKGSTFSCADRTGRVLIATGCAKLAPRSRPKKLQPEQTEPTEEPCASSV